MNECSGLWLLPCSETLSGFPLPNGLCVVSTAQHSRPFLRWLWSVFRGLSFITSWLFPFILLYTFHSRQAALMGGWLLVQWRASPVGCKNQFAYRMPGWPLGKLQVNRVEELQGPGGHSTQVLVSGGKWTVHSQNRSEDQTQQWWGFHSWKSYAIQPKGCFPNKIN